MLKNAEIYRARRGLLKKKLLEAGLDGLIVLSAPNRFYLSGFELHDGQCDESSGFLLITAAGSDWLFTDSRYELAAKAIWPEEFVRIYKGDSLRQLATVLKKNTAIAAFERVRASWNFVTGLRAEIRQGEPVLTPASGLVEDLRMIKEPCEIAALEKSFALNHKIIAWLDAEVKQNSLATKSEEQLAWEIEKSFRENGASELAFATIVAEGKNAALPHATPRTKQIGGNTSLLVDLGCRVDGYCSDQTRSWWLGENPPAYYADALKLVQEAQQAALAIMKAGVACADVYRAALAVFEKAGQAGHFTHGLGHGVGLQTHEGPTLSPRSSQVLRQGMVVTVEPGLYYPEWGGVRWEHTVLVQKDGVKIF